MKILKKILVVIVVVVIAITGTKIIPPYVYKIKNAMFLNQYSKHQTYGSTDEMQTDLQGDWVSFVDGRMYYKLTIKGNNCTGKYLNTRDKLEMSFDVTWNPSKGTFTWLTDNDIYIVNKGAGKLIEYESGNEYIRQ